MNNDERKRFWDTLYSLKSAEAKDKQELANNITYPESLFRYRSINKNTLSALENNESFFSSAAYFDDPFDVYFY